MFYFRLALSILGFVVASLYGVAIALLRRDRSRVAHDYAMMLVRLMRPPLGMRSVVIGREHLTAHQPCIYIANHQSAYDVPLLAELYPPNTVIIGKKELRDIPFFGWLYAITGNIFIDRSNNASAVGRLREAEEAIRSRGVSVWVFPEGTRGKVPGRLMPFKKGAFYMAAATRVPVVPIVVEPLQPIFDLARRHLRSATVEIRILEPIHTRGGGEVDAASILATAQERMQATLDEMGARRRGVARPVFEPVA